MAPPREDEVLVRVAAAGVCHSDVRLADGELGDGRWPMVMGSRGRRRGRSGRLGRVARGARRPRRFLHRPGVPHVRGVHGGTVPPVCARGPERAARDDHGRDVEAVAARRNPAPARSHDRVLRRVHGRRSSRRRTAASRASALAGVASRVRRRDRVRRGPERRPGPRRRVGGRGRLRWRRAASRHRASHRGRCSDHRRRPRPGEARARARAGSDARRGVRLGDDRRTHREADGAWCRSRVRGRRTPGHDASRLGLHPAGWQSGRRRGSPRAVSTSRSLRSSSSPTRGSAARTTARATPARTSHASRSSR